MTIRLQHSTLEESGEIMSYRNRAAQPSVDPSIAERALPAMSVPGMPSQGDHRGRTTGDIVQTLIDETLGAGALGPGDTSHPVGRLPTADLKKG